MRARTKTIEPDVLEVLKNVEIDGNNVRITQQLDRKLYVKTNDALVALGGKWNKKAKAHVFEEDPRQAIAAAVGGGTYESVQAAEKEAGYFPTPVELAKKVVDVADIRPGDRVLEPSAGQGRIADEVRKEHPDADLYLCELLEGNIDALIAKGYPRGRICPDFLRFQPVKKFDRIVMNPPFAKQADIEHVTRAYEMLAPGGKLVSIMSPSFQYRNDKKSKAFRGLVNAAQGIVFDNPPGSFKEAGTDVNTVLVILSKERTEQVPPLKFKRGDEVVDSDGAKGVVWKSSEDDFDRYSWTHRVLVMDPKTRRKQWRNESSLSLASDVPPKRKSSRRSSKKDPNPWDKVGYFIGTAMEAQMYRGPIPDLAALQAIDRIAEAQGNTAGQLVDNLKSAGRGSGGGSYAFAFLMEGITPKLDKDLKLATGRTREEWLRVGNQMENRAADMDLDAMVREIDELIDRLEIPNARGFAVRIPQSKFYRKPPARGPLPPMSDVPSRGEIENMLWQLRKEEEIRQDNRFRTETKERLAQQAKTPADPATAAAMENVKRSPMWSGLPVRARRNVLRMIENGPLYAEFFGSTSEKVQKAAAKRLEKSGHDLSNIQAQMYEGVDTWEWAKHEHKLNILAPDAFAKLTELEGKAWAADERKHADEPGRFLDAQDAYRILKDSGLTQTHTLADVADSPGFIGANDEIYVVLRDGEIALLEDTATPAKVEKAEQTLRVIIPEDPDPFETAAAPKAPKPASVRRSSSRSEYREGGAEGMTADQIVTRTWTLDELESMPTLATGHFDDLKIRRGDVQVWISRDEGQERNKVYVERLINGKWDEVRSYRATRKPASARKSSKKASAKAKSTGLDAKFQAALDGYIEAIRQAQKRFFKKDPVIGYEVNRKYIRVYEIKGTLDRSAHSFVDRANGDIYKSDGWKRPAKHARGNIFRDPAEALDEMGFVVYLA